MCDEVQNSLLRLIIVDVAALVTVYDVASIGLGRLGVMAKPSGGDEALACTMRALRERGVDTLVSLLEVEEALRAGLEDEARHCANAGLAFSSFPIRDLSAPNLSHARQFLTQLHIEIASGKYVVLHCYAGIGRSGMFATALLLLAGVELEQACESVSAKRGKTVPETSVQCDWLRRFLP
ncbi:MAG: tyrosine-protein phosphatase [Gammaproteobacteria bacterium]|nr:tyrosine-protein phosphatase [Gammaproteobacteria bacterium]